MTRVPLAGVIGCPVGHSRSPAVHGYWLRHHDVPGHYVPLHVEAGDLQDALRTLPRIGFRGVNITLPHKECALALADAATDAARRIGAANTLTFGESGLVHADNTDGYGFIANLRQNAPRWRPDAGSALILGAGGAARAVVVALQEAGAPEVIVANRTAARAEALAESLGATALAWEKRDTVLSRVATVVNTTSLGMTGHPALDLPLDRLTPGALVTDIVYTPLQTDLLARAAAQGAMVVDGLGMLLHQAVPGFARWFGPQPAVTDALRRAVLAG